MEDELSAPTTRLGRDVSRPMFTNPATLDAMGALDGLLDACKGIDAGEPA